MQLISSGRLVYQIVHMIFPSGSLHLEESTPQNQVCSGGRVYHLCTCDFQKVYHLEQ